MSLRNQNWITFGGEPVTGRTPTQVRVSADTPGLVMNAQQEGFVAHAYKLFCDAIRVSAFPDGYHVQNRRAPDGTEVRMESNLGVHRVFVRIKGGKEVEVEFHGIGVALTHMDGALIDGWRVEVEPDVFIPQPFILTPKLLPNGAATSQWRLKKVKQLLGGQAVWVSHNKRMWLTSFSSTRYQSSGALADVVGSTYITDDQHTYYEPWTPATFGRGSVSGPSDGSVDWSYAFKGNETFALKPIYAMQPPFVAQVDAGRFLFALDVGSTIDLYRGSAKAKPGLSAEDEPPESAEMELVSTWSGYTGTVDPTSVRVRDDGRLAVMHARDFSAGGGVTFFRWITAQITDEGALTGSVENVQSKSPLTTTQTRTTVVTVTHSPAITATTSTLPTDCSGSEQPLIRQDLPFIAGDPAPSMASNGTVNDPQILRHGNYVTQRDVTYGWVAGPGQYEVRRFPLGFDADGAPIWGYHRRGQSTGNTMTVSRTEFGGTGDFTQTVNETFAVDLYANDGVLELPSYTLPLGRFTLTGGATSSSARSGGVTTNTYTVDAQFSHVAHKVLVHDHFSGAIVAYKQWADVPIAATWSSVGPHNIGFLLHRALICCDRNGSLLLEIPLGSVSLSAAYMARFGATFDPISGSWASAHEFSLDRKEVQLQTIVTAGTCPHPSGGVYNIYAQGERTEGWYDYSVESVSTSQTDLLYPPGPIYFDGSGTSMPFYLESRWAKDPISNAMLANIILRRTAMTGPDHAEADQSWLIAIDDEGARELQEMFDFVPQNAVIWQAATLNSLVSI